jgi:MFS family permease
MPNPPRLRADAGSSTSRRSGDRPAYARLWIGTAIAGMGAQLTIVAVGLQIYDITHSTFAVSLVGGFALIPMIVAGLWGGMLADAFDRRRVLIVSSVVGWSSTFGLIAIAVYDAASAGRPEVWPLYLLTTVNAVAATISMATRAAVTPAPAADRAHPGGERAQRHLVRAAADDRAGARRGARRGRRLLVDLRRRRPAVHLRLPRHRLAAADGAPARDPAARPAVSAEGLRFLRHAPNIRAGFLIDLLAMGFGRPQVLFPAVGALVIGGGPITVGILTASAAIGTFLTSLLSGPSDTSGTRVARSASA